MEVLFPTCVVRFGGRSSKKSKKSTCGFLDGHTSDRDRPQRTVSGVAFDIRKHVLCAESNSFLCELELVSVFPKEFLKVDSTQF